MGRKRFDHFYIELCCTLDQLVPRYALWLEMQDRGMCPDELDGHELLAFFDRYLNGFLARRGTLVPSRSRRRLRRRLERYDPRVATPYELMERLAAY
jgi:hypothetical protein